MSVLKPEVTVVRDPEIPSSNHDLDKNKSLTAEIRTITQSSPLHQNLIPEISRGE